MSTGNFVGFLLYRIKTLSRTEGICLVALFLLVVLLEIRFRAISAELLAEEQKKKYMTPWKEGRTAQEQDGQEEESPEYYDVSRIASLPPTPTPKASPPLPLVPRALPDPPLWKGHSPILSSPCTPPPPSETSVITESPPFSLPRSNPPPFSPNDPPAPLKRSLTLPVSQEDSLLLGSSALSRLVEPRRSRFEQRFEPDAKWIEDEVPGEEREPEEKIFEGDMVVLSLTELYREDNAITKEIGAGRVKASRSSVWSKIKGRHRFWKVKKEIP